MVKSCDASSELVLHVDQVNDSNPIPSVPRAPVVRSAPWPCIQVKVMVKNEAMVVVQVEGCYGCLVRFVAALTITLTRILAL